MSHDRIIINGALGEGGGQILRNAICYAAILKKPIQINNIRANRSKPGLRAQHVTGLRLASQIAHGRLEGDDLHSTSIRFTPQIAVDRNTELPETTHGESGERKEGYLLGDTKTAGSICLLLQAAIPCAILGGSNPLTMDLRGGTNADLAPQYDYFQDIFLPIAGNHFGFLPHVRSVQVRKRGYFPRGGGVVQVRTTPFMEGKALTPMTLLHRGNLKQISIRAFHAGKVGEAVALLMVNAAKKIILDRLGMTPSITIVNETRNAVGNGAGLIIIAETDTGCLLGGSALGNPKKKSHKTGEDAALELVNSLDAGGCVDDWLQDQLIIYMALANGTSSLLTGSLTLHTKTAILVAEQMCGVTFDVERVRADGEYYEGTVGKKQKTDSYGEAGRAEGKHIIRCCGISFLK